MRTKLDGFLKMHKLGFINKKKLGFQKLGKRSKERFESELEGPIDPISTDSHAIDPISTISGIHVTMHLIILLGNVKCSQDRESQCYPLISYPAFLGRAQFSKTLKSKLKFFSSQTSFSNQNSITFWFT